ncbi:MAG: helix-turn-helix domain-containing protein [Candidatus Sedimenticola sp. (ex Thyasira tokunagai)]
MNKRKNAAPLGQGATADKLDLPESTVADYRPPNNTVEAQQFAIERALRELGAASTIFFRERLGISAPAVRIFELRHGRRRLNIRKHPIAAIDGTGTPHKGVALYYLAPGRWEVE